MVRKILLGLLLIASTNVVAEISPAQDHLLATSILSMRENIHISPHRAAADINQALANHSANPLTAKYQELLLLKAEVSLIIDETSAAFDALDILGAKTDLSPKLLRKANFLRAKAHLQLGQIDAYRRLIGPLLEQAQSEQPLDLLLRLAGLKLALVDNDVEIAARETQVLARYISLLPDNAKHAATFAEFAQFLATQGKVDDALALQQRIINIYQAAGSLHGLHIAHYHSGSIYLDSGQPLKALSSLQLAADYADQLESPIDSAFAYLKMAKVALSQHRREHAIQLATRANDLVQQHNILRLKIDSWETLAEANSKASIETTVALLKSAYDYAVKGKIGRDRERLALKLADAYHQQGRLEAAYLLLRSQFNQGTKTHQSEVATTHP